VKQDSGGGERTPEVGAEVAVGLVEKVARIIAEYPDEWLWEDANASQRSHYEALAVQAINAVREANGLVSLRPATGAELEQLRASAAKALGAAQSYLHVGTMLPRDKP